MIEVDDGRIIERDKCGAYGPAGCLCVSRPEHDDLHDCGYCQWDSTQSLSRADAAAILEATARAQGRSEEDIAFLLRIGPDTV